MKEAFWGNMIDKQEEEARSIKMKDDLKVQLWVLEQKHNKLQFELEKYVEDMKR